jgi:hypothetical protein
MGTYYVKQTEGDWQPIEADDVEGASESYVDQYADPAEGSTYWIDLTVLTPTAEEIRIESYAVDPLEPECPSSAGHHWTTSGQARGNGGGVRWVDRCSHCGLERHRDTWAQDRVTGRQGLDAVRYVRRSESEAVPN